jgi:hypothetical protein
MKKHTAEMYAVEYRAGKDIRGICTDILRRDKESIWDQLRLRNPGSAVSSINRSFRVVKVRIEWESR